MTWIQAYRGKDHVRGYSRWFGTDRLCAIVELRLLGVGVPEERLVEAPRLARQGVRPRPRPSSSSLDVLDIIADDPIALRQLGEDEALDRHFHPGRQAGRHTGAHPPAG